MFRQVCTHLDYPVLSDIRTSTYSSVLGLNQELTAAQRRLGFWRPARFQAREFYFPVLGVPRRLSDCHEPDTTFGRLAWSRQSRQRSTLLAWMNYTPELHWKNKDSGETPSH